jgi:hypothetical protein
MGAIRNSNFYEVALVGPDCPNTVPPVYACGYTDQIDCIDADGTVPVPTGPGLGVVYDRDFIVLGVEPHEVRAAAHQEVRLRLQASDVFAHQALIAFSRSATERNTPRLRARSVSSAKKRSTWLIHHADAGVKCTCQRGRLANQFRINFVLCVP